MLKVFRYICNGDFMGIKNDIVYADNPTPILRVRAAKPLNDYKL